MDSKLPIILQHAVIQLQPILYDRFHSNIMLCRSYYKISADNKEFSEDDIVWDQLYNICVSVNMP